MNILPVSMTLRGKGLFETLSKTFKTLAYKMFDIFTGANERKLGGFRGLKLLIKPSRKYIFRETELGLHAVISDGDSHS